MFMQIDIVPYLLSGLMIDIGWWRNVNFVSLLICIQGLLMKHHRIGSVDIWVILRRRTQIAGGGRGRSRRVG